MSINLFNSYIRLGKPTMTNRQLQETSFFFVSKSAVFPCNYLSLFKREDLLLRCTDRMCNLKTLYKLADENEVGRSYIDSLNKI